MEKQSASRAGAAIGAMIFSVFGSGWLFFWAARSFAPAALMCALISGLGLALFFAAFRQYRRNREAHAAAAESPENKKEQRIFNIVNIVQGVAIFLSANIAKNIGHPEWFVPAFIFIVGAHFIPLAKVFHSRRHTVIGVAMMVWALAYPQLAQSGAADPVGCLGAGLILWASALSALLFHSSAQPDAVPEQ
ncbi:DUF7010 family protein [Undibacterium aquatile]|uniref:Uncharacterized protein n=1 Tax=Undibacterium aquatile TaxID=1537398 RepID=A0ABR6XC34_9BURK|nr:hypothetical protein [Undibacterium aquatile]MBC3810130.1 hypothetical protein [Undibacterium aquatile]